MQRVLEVVQVQHELVVAHEKARRVFLQVLQAGFPKSVASVETQEGVQVDAKLRKPQHKLIYYVFKCT